MEWMRMGWTRTDGMDEWHQRMNNKTNNPKIQRFHSSINKMQQKEREVMNYETNEMTRMTNEWHTCIWSAKDRQYGQCNREKQNARAQSPTEGNIIFDIHFMSIYDQWVGSVINCNNQKTIHKQSIDQVYISMRIIGGGNACVMSCVWFVKQYLGHSLSGWCTSSCSTFIQLTHLLTKRTWTTTTCSTSIITTWFLEFVIITDLSSCWCVNQTSTTTWHANQIE